MSLSEPLSLAGPCAPSDTSISVAKSAMCMQDECHTPRLGSAHPGSCPQRTPEAKGERQPADMHLVHVRSISPMGPERVLVSG